MKQLTVYILLLSLGICGLPPAHAQPEFRWMRTYGGEATDDFSSVIQTRDGGFALAGETISFDVDDYDAYLVKTDDEGAETWSHTYDIGYYDNCLSLIQTSDGGFALAGYTAEQDAGSSFLILKTDSDGEEEWSRTFSRSYWNECYSVVQTPDGGFVLAGFTSTEDYTAADYFVVKVDSAGELVWENNYGGAEMEFCMSLVPTGQGAFMAAGYVVREDSMGASCNFYLVKIAANGRQMWSRTFETDTWDLCIAITHATGGGYALAGFTNFGQRLDCRLIRINDFIDHCDLVWEGGYGGAQSDYCNAIVNTPDGGFVLAGSTNSSGAGEDDFFMVRTDDAGEEQWSRTFGSNFDDVCFSIIRTPDRGYALAGYTESFGAGGADGWLVKTGSDPVSAPVITDPSIPQALVLLPVYPNPFNSAARIRYQVSQPGRISLSLHNLTGRKIMTLTESWMNAGTHETMIYGNSLSDGTYLITLDNNGKHAATKMQLIK